MSYDLESTVDLDAAKLLLGVRSRCSCPNCRVKGGNRTFNPEGKLLHSCHYPRCSRTFVKTCNLKAHYRKHFGERPFLCQIEDCDASFARSDELDRHLAIHFERKSYLCESCGKPFARKDHLRVHLTRVHSDPDKVGRQPRIVCDCPNCHRSGCDVLINDDGKRLHICKYRECGRIFDRVKELKEHLDRHSGNRDYVCDICGKGFIRKDELRKHGKVHAKVKTYLCETCGREFKNYWELLEHSREHKEPEQEEEEDGETEASGSQDDPPKKRNYTWCECPNCKSRGDNKLLSCSGKRTHICHIASCGKTFVRVSDLRTHLRRHAGERPFACHCGKSFVRKDELRVHQISHTKEKSHKCHCGKTFAKASSLQDHQMAHKGLRPFECEVEGCGKSFTKKDHLVRHARVHTQEKKYECQVCGVKFARSDHLKSHQKSHEKRKKRKKDKGYEFLSEFLDEVEEKQQKGEKLDETNKTSV